jgi:hypothetical protein
MRRVFVILAVAGLLLAACAEDNPTIGGETSETGVTAATGGTSTGATGDTSTTATAADCATENADAFKESGTLTIGTGNPAFPPWWEGGEIEGSDFEFNDPANGQGYGGGRGR